MTKKQPENEPVQLKNLSAPRKTAAKNIVGAFGENIATNVRGAAAAQQRQSTNATDPSKASAYAARSRRLNAVAPIVKPKKLTVTDAAKNRVALIGAASRDIAPKHDSSGEVVHQWAQGQDKTLDKSGKGKPVLGGVRLPNEAIAGLGFYHQEHRTASEALPGNDAAFGATAAASSRSRVEDEQASFGEIARSHNNGAKIFMHPRLAKHLQDAGAPVPAHMINRSVGIHEIPAESLAKLANPDIRQEAQVHATGVDLKQLAKTNREDTRVTVIKAVRGETAVDKIQNPHSAPKTASFAINKREATGATEDEFLARMQHLGRAERGEVSGSQQMMDFHGLRNSNEGILSNEGHTTEDSWMHSTNYHHMVDERYPDRKVMGEVVPGNKAAEVNGKKVSVHSSPDFGGQGVYHAFGNAATTEAAKMLEKKHNFGFAVPAAGIQEVAWSAARRMDRKETSPEFKQASRDLDGSLRDQVNHDRHQVRKNTRLNNSFEKNTARMTKGTAPKSPADGMLF